MQQSKIIKRELKKQKNLNARKRKLIHLVFERQYDPLLQYADRNGEIKVEHNLHYKGSLIPVLEALGYELFARGNEEFIRKI